MEKLFEAHWLVDLVIACILVEALALAFPLALSGSVWPWVCLCLAAAGVAHTLEVRRRWRS